MIVKMIILSLLGSSDDKEKEKIGVARPEGPPLRVKKGASVHWASYVPETMSRPRRRFFSTS